MKSGKHVMWYSDCRMSDVERVGGKNASLGEMISALQGVGVKVPDGFATTADAFRHFLKVNALEEKINDTLRKLDVEDISALTQAGDSIRKMVCAAPLPDDLVAAIRQAYSLMTEKNPNASFAVRSSATAEDLPEASFAGQQETFLNVTGIDNILEKVKLVFASLYNDRAIAYRVHHGFEHAEVALSAGIQRMVRSDKAASGVMFSIDTESGFDKVVFVTSSYGLGELVVQGSVNPDEFYVYKPALEANKAAIVRRNLGLKQQKMVYASEGEADVCIQPVSGESARQFSVTDEEVEALAKQAVLIEAHYGRPMDIEWAKDGQTGELMIVQARPETVQSRQSAQVLSQYRLNTTGPVLVEGRSIGAKIGQGTAKVIKSLDEMDKIKAGDVLVTDMTDPDWEPIMKKAAAIVTNRGGRTCHAAIIARELGIPAVVGCVNATSAIQPNQKVTVSCAEGDTGYIYDGLLDFVVDEVQLDNMPDIPFKIMMNVGNPERAFHFHKIPNHGVGLARLEFIISQMIGVHPNACLGFHDLPKDVQQQVADRTAAYISAKDFYIEKLAEGIASIAVSFADKPVIIRLSDFKSNEYANLIGGQLFEPSEENPMLGFRGASRYVAPNFKAAFELECMAVKKVREEMGLDNVAVMVPFVRTVEEAKAVLDVMAEFGLKRGEHGLQVMMMCELPTNALLAKEYLTYFDGFSIGSNDMTQLTLGLDRDSALVAEQFDERDPAVKMLLQMAIKACRDAGKYIGICGQGPSDHPDLAEWLIEQGIESVSLNPDTVLSTWLFLADQQH